MKKIISTLFVMSLSLNAFAKNNNSNFNNNIKCEKTDIYTCVYEYYEEVILASGDITYVFIRSEIVECEAENAGKVFEYVYEQNGISTRIKPKRHGVIMN